MRCTQCGSIIPPGLPQCPICGARPDSVQAQEDFRFHQPYPKTNYQQGVPPTGREYGYAAPDEENQPRQYATPAFHTYRTQMLTGFPQSQSASFQPRSRDGLHPGGAFAKVISDLPQVIKGAFLNPMGTLQGMIRREDRLTGGIIILLSLLFAFVAGMIMVRSALGSLFSMTTGITGLQLADSAASLHQGVSYVAGKIAVPIGGITVICQLIAVIIPVMVTMVYLSVMRQVRLSFYMLSGFAAIITLPSLMALVLASVCSLITPYLSILSLLFGQVVSYVLLCTIAMQLANHRPKNEVMVQASLICLTELIKIILIAVVGSAMMTGVIRTLTSLIHSMGGLL